MISFGQNKYLKAINFLSRIGQHVWILLMALGLFCSSTASIAYSPYSNNELEQLEKEFIQQINQSDSVIRVPLASQYINHLAEILAKNGQLHQPFFFLVRSNEINAFAGPGGYIGVNSQLILATDNESELAAVMAHEMAHVRLHHLYRMIERQKQMRIPMLASMLASIALGVVNPSLGSGALMASLNGFAQESINFVRSNEKEADRIGIDVLTKSGLDPRGMPSFFKKMQQSTRYYYSENIPAILRTHPLDEDRIAEAENRCTDAGKKTYPKHLEYYLFKELIRTNVANDNKRLLEYYQKGQCVKNNPENACQYGYALTLLSMNEARAAKEKLQPLLNDTPDNLFYSIAMAQADMLDHQYNLAIARLKDLQNNYPDNYAAMMELAQSLIEANQAPKAAALLIKASREFKKDLPMCFMLARAQAKSHRLDYAYFTQANCHLLQGQTREAMRQLKLAKSLDTHDRFLKARIAAKMEEIKAASPVN